MGILNTKGATPKILAEKLYDPKKKGVVSLPSFLKDGFRKRLLKELKEIGDRFEEQPLQVRQVYQDLSAYRLTEEDNVVIGQRFPRILELREAFIGFWQDVLREGGCTEGGFNETEALYYQHASTGISFHRDHLRYRNLIGVFSIEGEGRFFAAKDRRGLESEQFEISPGSLVLMRAPRTGRRDNRPYHKLEKVVGDRYALSFRQREVTPGRR